MRKIFLICVLICGLFTSVAQAAKLQSRIIAGTGGEDSKGLAYNSNIAANSLLVIACAVFQDTHNAANAVFSDTKGNSWTISANVGVDDAGLRRARLYVAYALNTGGAGANTITCNPPGSDNYISIVIIEYSGMQQASVLDKFASSSLPLDPGTVNVVSGTTTAISQPSELVIGFMMYDISPSVTIAANSPCIVVEENEDNELTQAIAVCDHTVSAVAAQSVGWTLSGAAGYAAVINTFRIAIAETSSGMVIIP